MTTPRNPRKPVQLGVTGKRVSERLKELRQPVMSLRALSKMLELLGHPISADGLSKIEIGKRRVDVDDLMAIAVALDVSPLSLLMPATPDETDRVQLTEKFETDARTAWKWARIAGITSAYLHQPEDGEVAQSWAYMRTLSVPRWMGRVVEFEHVEAFSLVALRLLRRLMENVPELTREEQSLLLALTKWHAASLEARYSDQSDQGDSTGQDGDDVST